MLKDLTHGAVELESPTVKTDNARKPSSESRAPDSVHADRPSMVTRFARFVARNYNNFFTKIPWAIAIIVILAVLIQGLFEHVIVIQAISVPPALAATGYTPEVAGNRLRDAIADFTKSANSHMKAPDVALQGDLPNIVVPAVGISLDAVLAALRTLFRSTRSRTVTGEFTIVGNQLWLHLRLDGQTLFVNAKDGQPDNPDALLKAAAQSVVQEIQPYYVPASMSNSDPSRALVLIDSIISRYKDTDPRNPNLIWAYNLKGVILTHRKDLTDKNDYSEAKQALNTALQLDTRLAAAYVNMGNILKKEGDREGALADYHKAIKIDPEYALAHYVLARYLEELKRFNDAIDEYRKAIKYDFDNATYHFNLAYQLAHAGAVEVVTQESIDEYRQAIRIKPAYSLAHNNLGHELQMKGQFSEAITEYEEAIKDDPNDSMPQSNLANLIDKFTEIVGTDPKNTTAHIILGDAFQFSKKYQQAVAEYRAAIKVDPNNVSAQNGLGITFGALGMTKDATAEFQSVLKIDPNNATALAHLKNNVQ